MKNLKGLTLLAVALFLTSGIAGATVIDLTTEDSWGEIDGAYFVQIDPSATGTGLIDSFVQVEGLGNAIETEAYNTTENGIFDNGSADNFNHSITLGHVPVISDPANLPSGDYRQFMLDINENNNAALDQYLSLDEIQVFVGGTANSMVTSFTDGILDHDGALVYQMDETGDHAVALNYALNTGSGSGDMFFYLPNSWFSSFENEDVVTLYSYFGKLGEVDPDGTAPFGNYNTSDGFEEWAVVEATEVPPPVIPEPSTLLLFGSGLAALGIAALRRRK